MIRDSICRIRSRVTPYTLPISSRVLGCPSVSPNRMDTTPASRSDSVPSTECSCSCSRVKLTASPGWMASESSIRSPSSLSPSSPSGVCREIGSRPCFCTSMTFSGVMSSSAASSGGGLAAQVLKHLPLHPGQPADGLGHVHREADGAGLVGHGPGDRLPDPPGGIGGELVAPGVVEFLHAADQAEVALLDQVEEEHPAPGVPPGQRDDQAQVGLQQVVLGLPAVFGDLLKVDPRVGAKVPAAFGELLLGEQPGLNP